MRQLFMLLLIVAITSLFSFESKIESHAIGEDETNADTFSNLLPVEIQNDQGGPVLVRGEMRFTNPFFGVGVSDPIVLLEDQTGFVQRDLSYTLPIESQVFGQFLTDPRQSPVDFTIPLPIEPQGPLHDVHFDGIDQTGVQIYAIAYQTNTFGDIYLEQRDLGGGGWSTDYASTRTGKTASNLREVIGGTLLIWSPDDQQAFPTGFGADRRLFTQDDPLGIVPAGYTVVNLDGESFTFDRSAIAAIDILESDRARAERFTDLDYDAAFAAMVDKFRREYAYTDYYDIDWDALEAQFAPRIAQAQRNQDFNTFSLLLQEFIWMVPDGHLNISLTQATFERFLRQTDGGIGMAIRDVDSGSVIVSFLTPDGPADRAGIQARAQIIAFDDVPINDVIANTQPFSAPFSTRHVERLQQLRYATRFELGESVRVTFRNPGGTEETVTLNATAEQESFSFSSFNRDLSGVELPVEYRREGAYMVVSVNDFLDDRRLTITLWERMVRESIQENVRGIIIDLRNNGGGIGFLADQMAAYFFDEPFILGTSGRYDEELDAFFFDDDDPDQFILPPANQRYDGEVVVLVGPACFSACEFFAYNLSLNDRATVIGQYPTGGLGGSVERFFMPGNIQVQMTVSREVDPDGNIHIEGRGVSPDVRVPVTEETLFADYDVILQAAIDFLDEQNQRE